MKFAIIKSRLRAYLAACLYILSKILGAQCRKPLLGNTRVLVFHHIDNRDRFEKILRRLRDWYHVISFEDYLCGKKHKNKINVVIALDDGYHSWHEHGLPLFKKYNVKPILFVGADFLSTRDNKWREFCKDRIHTWPEKPISWSELGELRAIGAEIGGHGLGHCDLTQLAEHETSRVVSQDKREISQNLQVQLRSFAYPFGLYNKQIIQTINKAGYQYGFSSESGLLEYSDSNYALKRTNVGMRSPIVVAAFVEGWNEVLGMWIQKLRITARKLKAKCQLSHRE